MTGGKWIPDLDPHMPLADAARHVLLARLHVVREYLPRAMHEADRDPEYVHQLRVGTRRADAAVRIFAPCLPNKVYKAARRRLRAVRRAAGAARDWDVFLIGLMQRQPGQPEREQAGLDFLIGYALGQRDAVQPELDALGQRVWPDFEGFVADIIAAVRPPHRAGGAHAPGPPATLREHARPLLSGLLAELERTASGDLTDYAQLHQVRIAGKRLRYAMEVFADCFTASFRDTLYPMVEEMQETLGRANDSHVAAERLAHLRERCRRAWPDAWPRLQPGVDSLIRHHRRRLPRERRRFLRWWECWLESGTEGLLTALLAPGPG
jgi:CHAD domain-containing protein